MPCNIESRCLYQHRVVVLPMLKFVNDINLYKAFYDIEGILTILDFNDIFVIFDILCIFTLKAF